MQETKFKQTEVGSIPEDWEVKAIGEIGEVRMCKRIMKYQTTEMGDVPFYKIGTFGEAPDAYISNKLFEEYKGKYSFPRKGEILVSAAGTIGRTVIFDGKPSYFQDSNIVWVDNNEKIVANKYLYYTYKTLDWNTSDTTIKRLYNDNFKGMGIPVPPLAEQERIASALTAADNLIASLDKQITKARNLKQATMQHLLSSLHNHSPLKPLGELGVTYSGLTGKCKQDFIKGSSCYITFLNVLNNPILKPELFESVHVDIDEKQNRAHKGDLFFNTSSETPEEVGVCALLNVDVDNLYLNSFCFGYRLTNKNVSPLYLSYFFRSKEGRQLMTAAAQGVTRYNLSKSTFNKMQVPIPPIEEQERIASILTVMDNQIAALEKKRSKYEMVKQGMMQQLLTGTIRLI